MQSEMVKLRDTASTILALSKAAWKLGSSLSRLQQDAQLTRTIIVDLAEAVRLLGNACDLVYAELEEATGKGDESPPPCNVDDKLRDCLAIQAKEGFQAIQDLDLITKRVREQPSDALHQAERQRKLDGYENRIASIQKNVGRHTDNLHTTLLLIKALTVPMAPAAPVGADSEQAKRLSKLRDISAKLQTSSSDNLNLGPSSVEATLSQCVHENIAICEASLTMEPMVGGQGAMNSTNRVADWVHTLESIRRDQRLSVRSEMMSNSPSIGSEDGAFTGVTSVTSVSQSIQEACADDSIGDDSEDDLDVDLAKAALDTGTKAFDAQAWDEAECLLQEALRALQQLPLRQRTFCDIFALQYRLAICAYHTHDPAGAAEALVSLVHQTAKSDEQRRYICDALYLLSHVHIRMGQVDRARDECGKALQARRRLLGKQSDAALEATALMAHIYFLLDKRARAKACLAMIPEARRDAFVSQIEEALGMTVEHVDSSSLRTLSICEDSDLAVKHTQSKLFEPAGTVTMNDRCDGPVSSAIPRSPTVNFQQPYQKFTSTRGVPEDLQSVAAPSISSTVERTEWRPTEEDTVEKEAATVDAIQKQVADRDATEKEWVSEDYSTEKQAIGVTVTTSSRLSDAGGSFTGRRLSRKEILDKVGCQPRDRIEEAVCNADYSIFASLVGKKKDSWRSKLRKRVRPERVTALHFAALFGEIDMARQLLGASFGINEVPYGYSTSHTPLKFAIGARHVDMVQYLVANGAKPSPPDTWATMAGQVMNRSWLLKTMSEAEKEDISYIPNKMIAIFQSLLQCGWDVNAPIEPSGRTALHQAVSFWTGSYRWDLNLRATITTFLCERGAHPFKADREGKTAYDLALASGYPDILRLLDPGFR